MLDTNVLISAALFPNQRMDRIFKTIVTEHELVLSDLIIQELLEVAAYEKFNKVKAAREFLGKLSYSEIKSPPVQAMEGLSIRDEDDYPILFAAVKSGVDIFITGDKDFLESSVLVPRMMSLNDFDVEFCRKH